MHEWSNHLSHNKRTNQCPDDKSAFETTDCIAHVNTFSSAKWQSYISSDYCDTDSGAYSANGGTNKYPQCCAFSEPFT